MRLHKSAFYLCGVCVLLIARFVSVNTLEITLPAAPTPTVDHHIFGADQTVIPAGGCITLAWNVPQAARVILRGSNWPEGTQEGVSPSGSSIVCPSAATYYVPNEPVTYTLTVMYPDGHSIAREIVVGYEGMSEAQPMPTATFDPNATPAGIPVTPDATVEAVFQTFENGWMLWRGDTNTIFVLLGDGGLLAYTTEVIPGLQDRIIPTPPAQRVQPAIPFNRLWLDDTSLAARIGWPTFPAQTYTARAFGQVTYGFGMTLPDGRYVNLSMAGAWSMGGITAGNWTVSGAPVTFMPPSYPTLSPTATPAPTLVGAVYQTFEHGFMVWREDQNCVFAYAEDAVPGDPDGNIIIPQAVRAMPDISSSYHYCQEVAGLPDNLVSDAVPPGLIKPMGALGRVWGYYPDVRAALGYATEPQQSYVSSVPPLPSQMTLGGGPFSIPQIRLPDGRVLWCGFRSATSGTCSVQS